MRLKRKTSAFSSAMLDAITPIISRSTAQEREDVGARLMATLHGRSFASIEGRAPKLSRDEHFATRMFRSFNEVHTCTERLKDFETYISRFPFSATRVTRSAYLQLIVEGHLHELYILRERLCSWLKQIARSYKSDARSLEISRTTIRLDSLVKASLEPLMQVRGSHVHEWRYDNPDIGRLQLIDILAKSPSDEFSKAIRLLRRTASQDTHGRLKTQTKAWNSVASNLIEAVYSDLHELLFISPGQALRYPTPRK